MPFTKKSQDNRTAKRVYIAARYTRYREMQEVAKKLRDHGFEVTSGWIGGNHDVIEKAETVESHDLTSRIVAEEDMRDLMRSDILLFIGDQPGAYRGGGRWFEMGVAYANNMEIHCIGEREILFQYLAPITVHQTLEDFLASVQPHRTDRTGRAT